MFEIVYGILSFQNPLTNERKLIGSITAMDYIFPKVVTIWVINEHGQERYMDIRKDLIQVA